MGSEESFNFAKNAKRTFEGLESTALAAVWLEFPHLTDEIKRDIVKLFLTNCDNYTKGLIQHDSYVTDVQLQQNVSSRLKN